MVILVLPVDVTIVSIGEYFAVTATGTVNDAYEIYYANQYSKAT